MALTVLSIAYPFAPVGPDAVGGAEQVLSALDHALVSNGHRSLVIASEGSSTAGRLIALPRGGVIAWRITDDAGEPLTGVHVQAMRYMFAPGGRRG